MDMYGKTGVVTNDVAKTVDDVINYVGKEINFAMTLGLGKPVLLINELYRRAKEDPTIKLKIITALSLEFPKGNSELEKRLVGPLAERIFGGSPVFDYMEDIRDGKLPSNVELYEFYSKAGSITNRPMSQRNHLPSHYTHVARDAYAMGGNVFGQLISCKEINGKMMYSMGCNTDICVGALDLVQKGKKEGKRMVAIGEVNEKLPFMYGDAIYEAEDYDILLTGPEYNNRLFAPPKDAVPNKDHMIGLNVSTLIKDGGTLQVGIGSLGDAIVNGLDMRHSDNKIYNEMIEKAGLVERYDDLIKRFGGTDTFEKGLYGSSEMFVDAFMQLYKKGILKRKVYDNLQIMQLIEEGKLSTDNIPQNILELLDEKDGIRLKLRDKDFSMLTKFGILKDGLTFKDGFIFDGDKKYDADLMKTENLDAAKNNLLGKKLKNGQVILGAFYLGPESFYNELNAMSEEERSQFGMSGVEKVNQLYGDEALRALQRKDGRFVNTGMVATILGAIAADQLENGRVVSGIGGQYNFVSMAHAIPSGKSIIMIRSTRGSGKNLKSNIVFSYGHCTVARHLRDIVVTEYGIAHIRGLSDQGIIEEMLKITDSRFQQQLVDQAKKAAKLRPDYEIPEKYRNNYPEKIDAFIKSYQSKGYFKQFPFGTDVTPEEVVLAGSLRGLKAVKEEKPVATVIKLITEMVRPVPEKALPYLKRMALENPAGFGERFQQKTVVVALRNAGRI